MYFTDIAVRALKSNGRTTYYWDDSTPGFGIRVGKRRKTWTIIRGAERELVTLGHYGRLSLADARTEAKKLLLEKPEQKIASTLFETAEVSAKVGDGEIG